MIIWSGQVWVVAAFIFGCLLAAEYIVEALSGDEFYYQAHGWPKLAGFLVAAIAVHGFALMRAKKKSRLLVDPETGEQVVLHADDSLFFIPLRYWPAVAACLGLIFLFVTEKQPA
jgi:hypothetical protein